MAWRDSVQHVVVLMLENQSFDRMLGFLRLDDPAQVIDGLRGGETIPWPPPNQRHLAPGARAPTPASAPLGLDPGHKVSDVFEQVFGRPVPPGAAAPGPPTMDGFVANSARQPAADGRPVGP